MVSARHVFYVEGYDPQGAEGYYRLFRRELKRFTTLWQVQAHLSDLKIESEYIAGWTIETAGPDWRAVTHYEFLRLEQFIGGNMAQPLACQLIRAARWAFDDLRTGTLLRIFRASWRFAIHLLFPQLMLLLWIVVPALAGWLAAVVVIRLAGVPTLAGVAIALALALALAAALRPLAFQWFVFQIANCWPYVREFASGQTSGYTRPIEVFAERVVAIARADQVDELLIIGHSAGGGIAPALVARAFEIDPDLARHKPRVVLMTLGSLLPAFTLHPAAEPLRNAIRRLASERSLVWVDCQSRKDWLNFWNVDPFLESGVGERLCTLRIWQVRFRDMLSAESIKRIQWNLFRMHYQFIMANDVRAPYDYFMLVCGPALAIDWAEHGRDLLVAFSERTAYDEHPVIAASAAQTG